MWAAKGMVTSRATSGKIRPPLSPMPLTSSYKNNTSLLRRLMLAGIDMLEPYVRVTAASANQADLLGGTAADARPNLAAGTSVSVSWGVGGCWTIEATNLLLQAVDAAGKVLTEVRSPVQQGSCYWQQLGTNGKGPADAKAPAYTIRFSATAVVPTAQGATHILIAVEAKTDGTWQDGAGAEGDSPKTPQTHLVRARGDPTWYGRNGRYEVVGMNGVTSTLQRLVYCATPSSCPPPAPLASASAPLMTAASGAGQAEAVVVRPAAAADPAEVGLEPHQMASGGRRSAVTSVTAAGATLAVAATHRWWVGLAGLGAVGVAVRGIRRRPRSQTPLFGSSTGYTVEGISRSNRSQASAANMTGTDIVTSELEV